METCKQVRESFIFVEDGDQTINNKDSEGMTSSVVCLLPRSGILDTGVSPCLRKE